jgi:cystathionine gamma-synthase
MKKTDSPKPGTLSVWAGEDGSYWQGATQVPVVHSVSFGYDDLDQWLAVGQGQAPGHIYGRNTNPTVQAFEEKVRILEDAEAATSFASGMAAVSNILFTLLSPGDRVVSIKDSYGGTNKLFIEFLPHLKYAHRAANLGAVETIAGPPATTSHVECTREERAAMGIPEGLVRYSVGIEDAEDLIADLEQALTRI